MGSWPSYLSDSDSAASWTRAATLLNVAVTLFGSAARAASSFSALNTTSPVRVISMPIADSDSPSIG
ncbi:hypothetical protein D3C74_498390 [compost metagenome]